MRERERGGEERGRGRVIDAYVHREGEIVLLKSTELKGDSN